jgi:hypothetical protein
MRFAPRGIAYSFAADRSGDPLSAFGYHGVWNMPRAIGTEAFWQVYRQLDERGTLQRDFGSLLRDVVRGRGGVRRMSRMIADRWLAAGRK